MKLTVPSIRAVRPGHNSDDADEETKELLITSSTPYWPRVWQKRTDPRDGAAPGIQMAAAPVCGAHCQELGAGRPSLPPPPERRTLKDPEGRR